MANSSDEIFFLSGSPRSGCWRMRQKTSMTLGITGCKVTKNSSRRFAADTGWGLLSRKISSRGTVGSSVPLCIMRYAISADVLKSFPRDFPTQLRYPSSPSVELTLARTSRMRSAMGPFADCSRSKKNGSG